ncbi:MAG: HlyD family secretion protein [Saprospiraceae bacterium]
MLNISNNSITNSVSIDEFKAYRLLRKSHVTGVTIRLLIGLLILVLLCLFLPWTQNISAKGFVTTRSPESRPQAIQSVIGGRIEKWYVQEGDFVNAGDTVVYITEVKSEYFDPALLERTSEQIDAKQASVESYDQKVIALEKQYRALKDALRLKREQTDNKILQGRNKITIDSIDLVALRTNLSNAENQLERTQELYDKGLKTLTELQEKDNKLQNTRAKLISQENKLLNQRNALINLQIELNAIEREYADKLAKSQSDRQSAVSARLESVASTAKLRNQLGNYTERQKFYYILAPQAGYITQSVKGGIGETVKEGADIATIMPSKYDLAIDIYVKPQDIPLIDIGTPVQLRFDGWPAIVISGWPETSIGVFPGKIVAIDRFIDKEGKYRVLISPDLTKRDWPAQLSIGTGANSFILLREVPIWYEVWRQLNGFPADFYETDKKGVIAKEKEEVKRKAPLKSVK